MKVVYHSDSTCSDLKVDFFNTPREYRNWKRRKAQRNIMLVKVKY